MRVFVTGVSGFVGQHLARELRQRGHAVGGTFLDETCDLPEVELHSLDLAAPRAEVAAALRTAIAGFAPERVVHLAGLAHVGSSWQAMPLYYRVNLLGTEEVLAAAGGAPVLFASSAEVYGPVPEEEQPIGEQREPAPVSPYALTKAAAERLVLARGGTVVRPFNMTGPGQSPRFALPAFAHQLAEIAAGRQLPVLAVGNLEARRDFVHVADGAAALALLVERGEAGGVYNVATGNASSIREALDLLLATSGVKVEIAGDERFLRPADIPLLRGSAEPLRRLGWAPRRTLANAVAELWQWSRERVAAEAAR
ncbi:MAG TPA: NAD-dependent epimerase/dehydratase family protein [Thermoanaerobaculia bacterium]|jgi:GDP-4-dehydro-6-deoxy-D-mannose reductase|nr:NAD-dependent epimerase/dehydratase family protein [Thermoanaerobaculia bacterium]